MLIYQDRIQKYLYYFFPKRMSQITMANVPGWLYKIGNFAAEHIANLAMTFHGIDQINAGVLSHSTVSTMQRHALELVSPILR